MQHEAANRVSQALPVRSKLLSVGQCVSLSPMRWS